MSLNLETRPSARTFRRNRLRLSLLEGFSLTQSGRPLQLPMGTQRLICFVALHDGPLQRIFVAGSLWPDTTERHAAANLRSALWRLSQPGPTPVLIATAKTLALAQTVWVDAREASEAARILQARKSTDATRLPPFTRFTKDLLLDWYEDWVIIERERFRQVRLHALENLSTIHRRAGRFAQAIDAALAAVSGEPLRESAHRVLIEAHLAEGNKSEAFRQYDLYCRLLRAEVGVPPSTALESMVHCVRTA